MRFGNVADLKIYHDGSNSSIQNSTGVLQLFGGSNQIRLKPQNDEEAIICNPNGNVELFFDNNKKIETLSNGAKITGAFNVNSSSLDSHQAVIEGGVAGTSTSSLALKTGSGANSKVADLSFYGTFISPTSDTGQRRISDITSGFSTGSWGTEYIAFHVGKGASDGNDTQALTDERVRMNKYGIRVSGNSNNPVNPDWDIASAITASGSFGGGIALIDGSAGFIQSLDGLGVNYYLRNATTSSTPEINIKAIANGAVELYFDANKKVETKSYGLLAENADTNILVHSPANSRGGLAALSTQRVALATTTSGDNIVFGFGSAEPVTSSNFTERFRIENGTGNIQIKNDNAKLQIGADLDLEILHDGNNSIIDEVGTGVLAIRSDTGINILKRTGDHSMIRAIPDGSVELYFAADRVFYTETRGVRLADNTRIFENAAHNTAIIQHADIHHAIILRGSSNADGTTITNTNTTTFREFGNFKFMCGDGNGSTNMSDRLEIKSAGIEVNGSIFLSSEFNMTLGSDAQRFFDAAVGSSALTFRGTTSGDANHQEMARFFRGGGCELNHDGSKKFETTSSGATVTGTLTASAFSGNGSALTNVPTPISKVAYVRQSSDSICNESTTSFVTAGSLTRTVTAVTNNTVVWVNWFMQYTTTSAIEHQNNVAHFRIALFKNGSFVQEVLPAVGNQMTSSETLTNEKAFTPVLDGTNEFTTGDQIEIRVQFRNNNNNASRKTVLKSGGHIAVFLTDVN